MDIAGVQVQVLHPPCTRSSLDTNNASLVLRFSHGAVEILFTGDIEARGEHILLSAQNSFTSEVVKVPHHGSRTSSTQAFVEAVSPQVAVMSLGLHNRFRFPAPEVTQRYIAQGSRVLRTDLAGAILVKSNGHNYQVEHLRRPIE